MRAGGWYRRPCAYSAICGGVSMPKSRSRFSLLGEQPLREPALTQRDMPFAPGRMESSCSRGRGLGLSIQPELSRLRRPIEHAVDLARHDEVVLEQSLDLLGGERDGRVTPAEADIRVMTFGLGELPDPLHERKCLAEITESKRAFDAVSVVTQLPIRRLLLQTQRFIARQRRNAAATRRAGFFREGFGHGARSLSTSWGQSVSDRSPRTRYRASR